MIKYFNLDNPAPYVTARSWVMTNLDTGEILFAKQEKEKKQVASLTKIMTFYCVHKIMESHGLDSDKIRVKVLESSTTPMLGGTSAELLPGEKMSVTELLYAMMLPSGNDAAQSLGIYFGNYLI
jgi:D-alanyl-D-alanine carboxypeptidase (penicillin-binding protein 5/6)